jgi:hypothetical protein
VTPFNHCVLKSAFACSDVFVGQRQSCLRSRAISQICELEPMNDKYFRKGNDEEEAKIESKNPRSP